MRVLAIETSGSQASVALMEGGRLAIARENARPKQSAERLLPLIAELLTEMGWARSSLDRIGVSLGPGSFTGLRVGIACAQGLALGLDVPLVGVTSLRAMARCVPDARPELRCPVLDARRGEVFVGAYRPGSGALEQLPPLALPVETARASVEALLGPRICWIGSGVILLGLAPSLTAPELDEPRALGVGLLAEELDPAQHPAIPVYVRDAGATLPNLGAPSAH